MESEVSVRHNPTQIYNRYEIEVHGSETSTTVGLTEEQVHDLTIQLLEETGIWREAIPDEPR